MIEAFNRVLYVICAVCVMATTALLLVLIWAEIDDETLWKAIGSGCVLLAASGIMLAINFHILKIKADIDGRKSRTQRPPDN